nr:hypothetical protein [Pelagibacterales bacterium]
MPLLEREETVKEIIEKILPSSEEFFVMTGYFYFSGYEQIYEQLKNKKVRILCGMDTDHKTLKTLSNAEIREEYYEKLVSEIQKTDTFDNKDTTNAYNTFVEKIKNGSLEIKFDRTKNNHTKLYIFKFLKEHNLQGLSPGVVLSGSANLTFSGLTREPDQELINMTHEKSDFVTAKKHFDKMWEKAEELLTKRTHDDYQKKVPPKIYLNKKPKPYELFIKVLNSYFPTNEDPKIMTPRELSGGRLNDFLYQIDAIQQGIDITKKHQGCIIADVVGLGKSIIASAIAKNLDTNNLIICKPNSKPDW